MFHESCRHVICVTLKYIYIAEIFTVEDSAKSRGVSALKNNSLPSKSKFLLYPHLAYKFSFVSRMKNVLFDVFFGTLAAETTMKMFFSKRK